MSDLAEFLKVRLAEDEAMLGLAVEVFDVQNMAEAGLYKDHFSPRRLLREAEAKRAVLAEHSYPNWPHRCRICLDDERGETTEVVNQPAPCLTLRALAAVYGDHPDYDLAWKP